MNQQLARRCGLSAAIRCIIGLAMTAVLSACGTPERSVPYLERPEVLASCKANRVDIDAPLKASDVFIDWAYLDYLAEPPRADGHKLTADLNKVVDYFLTKGLTALETNLAAYNAPHDRVGQIARVSIWPLGSPACKEFRFPDWTLQEMRKRGLRPEQCVGIEWLHAPTSPARIEASQSLVAQINGDSFELWRFNVSAGSVDTQGRLNPTIRLIDHAAKYRGGGKGYSGWATGCTDKNAGIQALNAAIVGQGNPLLRKPEMITVPQPEFHIEESTVSDAELINLR